MKTVEDQQLMLMRKNFKGVKKNDKSYNNKNVNKKFKREAIMNGHYVPNKSFFLQINTLDLNKVIYLHDFFVEH